MYIFVFHLRHHWVWSWVGFELTNFWSLGKPVSHLLPWRAARGQLLTQAFDLEGQLDSLYCIGYQDDWYTRILLFLKSGTPLSLVLGGIRTHNLLIFGQTTNASCPLARQEDSCLRRLFYLECQVHSTVTNTHIYKNSHSLIADICQYWQHWSRIFKDNTQKHGISLKEPVTSLRWLPKKIGWETQLCIALCAIAILK